MCGNEGADLIWCRLRCFKSSCGAKLPICQIKTISRSSRQRLTLLISVKLQWAIYNHLKCWRLCVIAILRFLREKKESNSSHCIDLKHHGCCDFLLNNHLLYHENVAYWKRGCGIYIFKIDFVQLLFCRIILNTNVWEINPLVTCFVLFPFYGCGFSGFIGPHKWTFQDSLDDHQGWMDLQLKEILVNPQAEKKNTLAIIDLFSNFAYKTSQLLLPLKISLVLWCVCVRVCLGGLWFFFCDLKMLEKNCCGNVVRNVSKDFLCNGRLQEICSPQ